MKTFRIAAFGDLVSEQGVALFERLAGGFCRQNKIDWVIANGENASQKNGIEPETARRLHQAGADVITTGNHVFRQRSIYPFLEECPDLLRPANYPAAAPGMGYGIYPTPAGRLLVINVLGVVYMESLASPFDTVDALLAKLEGKYDLAVMDVHAEATSEKIALARYFDGRLNAVFGTHTHVPTADMQILPKGTGYVTDLGMGGPVNSILGVKADTVIEKYRTKMPLHFTPADGPCTLQGVIFTLGEGACQQVERFCITE